ncbi:MAG: hypothetical protein WAW88_15220 [Nocardioides sp.]
MLALVLTVATVAHLGWEYLGRTGARVQPDAIRLIRAWRTVEVPWAAVHVIRTEPDLVLVTDHHEYEATKVDHEAVRQYWEERPAPASEPGQSMPGDPEHITTHWHLMSMSVFLGLAHGAIMAIVV